MSRIARWSWAAPLLILAAGAWAYHNSLQGPFILDDQPYIPLNPHIRTLWPIWEAMAPPPRSASAGPARPLVNLTLALNYQWSRLDVGSYHAVNLAIHLLAALVLYGLVGRLLRSKAVGLAVALLWIVHPLQTQSVTYIIQRAESLMGLWYLLMLYALLRAAEPDPTPGDGSHDVRLAQQRTVPFFVPPATRWQLLSICACWLGMATKPVMVTAPLLALLLDRTFLSGSFRAAWRQRKGYYLGLFASWAILIALIATTPQSIRPSAGFGVAHIGWWEYLRTQPSVILHYLRLSIWPHPLVFDYEWPIASGVLTMLMPTLILLAIIGGCRWLWRRQPATGFWAWWVFIVLAPSSSIVPVTDLAVEHRMYLPLAGAVALAVIGAQRALHRFVHSASLRLVVACGLLVPVTIGFALLTIQRNLDYRSELAIWQDTVIKRPANSRAHSNLGIQLADLDRLDEALAHYQEAVRLEPDYAQAHNNIGTIHAARRNWPAAIAEYRKALELHPPFDEAHNNLGLALVAQGHHEEAIQHYREALRLNPRYVDAHYNLGTAFMEQGRWTDAETHFRQAARLKPDSADAHNNLGVVLMRQNRLEEAARCLKDALRLNPGYGNAHNNLGAIFARQGDVASAAHHFAEAARLLPQSAEARNNLGVALVQLGRLEEAQAAFTEAVQLNPNSPARMNLEALMTDVPSQTQIP